MASDDQGGLGEGFQRGFALEDATSFAQLMFELAGFSCMVTGKQFAPVTNGHHDELEIYLLQPLAAGGRLEFANALVVETAVARLLDGGKLIIGDEYEVLAVGEPRPQHPHVLRRHGDPVFWPSRAQLAWHRRRVGRVR